MGKRVVAVVVVVVVLLLLGLHILLYSNIRIVGPLEMQHPYKPLRSQKR
jgi:hypothetical protein